MLGAGAVALIIIVVSLLSSNSYKSPAVPSKDLLAEVEGVAKGTTVKIGNNWSAEGYPSMSFDPLAPSEYTAPSLSCRPTDYLQRYFSGSASAYQAKLDKQATCVKGMARGADLAQQIADSEGGIRSIDTSLETNRQSRAILAKLPDAFAVIAFPAGANLSPQYQTVTAPKMMCVKDSVTKSVTPEVPVGPSTISSSLGFTERTAAQEKIILDAKAKAKAISDDPKLSDFDKGKAVFGIISELIGKALTVEPSTNRLQSFHKSVQGRGISAIVSAAKLENNECDPGVVNRIAAAASSPYITRNDNWYKTKVGFDELGISECFPYFAVLNMAIDGVDKHTATLTSLRSAHVTRAAKLNSEYKTLRDNGYNCK